MLKLREKKVCIQTRIWIKSQNRALHLISPSVPIIVSYYKMDISFLGPIIVSYYGMDISYLTNMTQKL